MTLRPHPVHAGWLVDDTPIRPRPLPPAPPTPIAAPPASIAASPAPRVRTPEEIAAIDASFDKLAAIAADRERRAPFEAKAAKLAAERAAQIRDDVERYRLAGNMPERPAPPSASDLEAVAFYDSLAGKDADEAGGTNRETPWPKPDPNGPIRNQEVDVKPTKKKSGAEPSDEEKSEINKLLESIRPRR